MASPAKPPRGLHALVGGRAPALNIHCPRCGEGVEVVNVGKVVDGEFNVILRCAAPCRRGMAAEYLLIVRLEAFHSSDHPLCGTEQGYQLHRRSAPYRSPVCAPCHEAHLRFANPGGSPSNLGYEYADAWQADLRSHRQAVEAVQTE